MHHYTRWRHQTAAKKSYLADDWFPSLISIQNSHAVSIMQVSSMKQAKHIASLKTSTQKCFIVL